jgi:ferric-dicitrate binding protein FerR (iron transport regulator)
MEIKDLISRLAAGTATEVEREQFNDWLDGLSGEEFGRVLAELEAAIAGERDFEPYRDVWLEALMEKVQREKPAVVRSFPMGRWVAAAVFVGLLGTGLLLWRNTARPVAAGDAGQPMGDAKPARAGAILTLDDGRRVVLDSLPNSIIATQQGTQVAVRNGKLVYTAGGASTSSPAVSFNTVTVPRGRQFQLSLPDGSRVWLNAASSIRYPTVFNGQERKVEISGEAYFEVAKNMKMPFWVGIDGHTTVEVLGTHFNVKAYPDEHGIQTTLLEGVVRVVADKDRRVLRPGEQADVAFAGSGSLRVVEGVDTGQVMAWKNGVFNFHLASLEEVMQQLSKWYDIDVRYEAGIPDKRFDGEMGRDVNLSKVLAFLQGSGVRFRLEENGKRLVIAR